MLGLLNIYKTLPDDFCLKKGNFAELEMFHTQLECTIEILFRILNYSGYCAEKNVHTSISGTHDVSHAIYATKTAALITTDLKFSKKCRAVYEFLGVKTDVVFCTQNKLINVF